ncbi:hypothetical protein PCASD_19514 [Puccinia coronata f. sp. avenae]|uniref:Uncharacterized protein n=1 Tax=Puccinia coronata f. sp. avenae TaxID=200324 RepID=A0A2N5TPM4_9BASI|nr:hypothetical protein PCASD_19514 [Puccinia coronata f. sp. avenae]
MPGSFSRGFEANAGSPLNFSRAASSLYIHKAPASRLSEHPHRAPRYIQTKLLARRSTGPEIDDTRLRPNGGSRRRLIGRQTLGQTATHTHTHTPIRHTSHTADTYIDHPSSSARPSSILITDIAHLDSRSTFHILSYPIPPTNLKPGPATAIQLERKIRIVYIFTYNLWFRADRYRSHATFTPLSPLYPHETISGLDLRGCV